MYLVAIAWIYVVGLMALVEAFSPGGSWLGAAVTFALYGALPLAITLYLMATPARRRRLRGAAAASAAPPGGDDPDRRGHPPGDPVAAKREEA